MILATMNLGETIKVSMSAEQLDQYQNNCTKRHVPPVGILLFRRFLFIVG